LDHLVPPRDGVLVALISDDEPLQQVGRNLLAARFAGLDGPGALEFLELFLEVRLVVRQGAGTAGRGETDGAEQCYERDPHTCSPRLMMHSDIAVERLAKAPWISLFHLGNLDEIPAGVVKNGRGDWPHVHGRLSEANSRVDETLVFRVHIL